MANRAADAFLDRQYPKKAASEEERMVHIRISVEERERIDRVLDEIDAIDVTAEEE